MDWNIILILILLVINFPVYRFLFSLIFTSSEDYDEAVRYTFTPNIISLFRGQYWDDKFRSMQLSFYIFMCALPVFLEYLFVQFIIGLFQ
jgi:hypothetical protein